MEGDKYEDLSAKSVNERAGESYEAPVSDPAIARRAHGIADAAFVAPHLRQLVEYQVR